MARRRLVPPAEWRDPRHRLGLRGEWVALAYLTACGWSVEAHRYRLGNSDIDLIARSGSTVAFVEVKWRSGEEFGSPIEAIGWRKRRAIARVAEVWRDRFGRPGDEFRFDLVGVTLGAEGPRVEHVPDAWRMDGGGNQR